MQSIDVALSNKPYDKPLNKSLHIINSVLTSVVKRNLENESDKRLVSTMGLLIDLAIFLWQKKVLPYKKQLFSLYSKILIFTESK